MKTAKVPFHERYTCSVREACQVAGWGHDKMFRLLKQGRVASVKVDHQRRIIVASLLQLLGLDESAAIEPKPRPRSAAQPAATTP